MSSADRKKIFVKAFAQAVTEIYENPDILPQFLKDLRPTSVEKDLLTAMFMMRKGHYEEIKRTVISLNPKEQFVSSIKSFILGICCNQLGQFSDASEHFTECYNLLAPYDSPKMKFICSFNHFFCNVNLHKVTHSKNLIDEIFSFDAKRPQDKIKQWRVGCMISLAEGDLTKAEKYLTDIDQHSEYLSESQRANLFYDKFQLLIHKNDLIQARELTMSMKSIRTFYNSPNYIFMKGLLDFIIDDSELYFYEKDFKGVHFLWWQVSVITNLQSKKFDAAREHWTRLQKSIPHIYGDDFLYQGEECLFKIALEKVYSIRELSTDKLPAFETKEELLAYILEECPEGILKNDLYKMIYGEDVQSKSDYDKLKQLVMRLRKKTLLDVKSRKGSYYLRSNDKKAS